jgi:general secretion pathway protein D
MRVSSSTGQGVSSWRLGRRAGGALATLAVVAALGVALGTARPAVAQDAPGDIEIVIGDEVTVPDLLKSVMKATANTPTPRYIVWSDQDKAVTGKKIQGAQRLRAPGDKLFEMIRGLLTFQEIVLVPIGPKGYEVWVAMDARTLQNQFILKNKPVYMEINDVTAAEIENQDGLFVATTLKVHNIDNLRDARTALSRIVTGQNVGNVQEVPAARAFVVTDFAPNVVAIYRLLKQMDVEPEGKKVVQAYIELQHAYAEDIEPILQDLFTGKQRVTQAQPGQPGGGDVQDPEPRIVAEPRTNMIIVYGIEDDIVEIKALVEKLDVQLTIVRQFVFVEQLKNLDAEDTATVLQTLIDGTTLFGSSGGVSAAGARRSTTTTGRFGGSRTTTTAVGARTPAATGPTGGGSAPEDEEKPSVVADKASNSLIIAASKRQYDSIHDIIRQIDIRKSQVMIEAALVELSLTDSFRFAIELGGLDDNGLKKNGGPSAFGGTGFGLTEFADRDGDGTFTDRLPPVIINGGAPLTGAVGGIFAAGQVPFIYRALNSVTKTHVLQLPSIVTTDNEEATIRVLDEQATTSTTVTSGGNTTGGFQNFEDAGTTLSISPHIANDSYLLLNINLEVSGFQGEPKQIGENVIPANRFRRNLQTAVVIPDRHTVVIGGLIGTTRANSVDKVPLLGDIPVLGEMFKSTNKGDRETNLFLFVTPTILKASDTEFKDFDDITCERKKKADELIGEVDIPFSNFFRCKDVRSMCDPASGCLRGSGSASDRLDALGALESTSFRSVDPLRLVREAEARRRALEPSGGR